MSDTAERRISVLWPPEHAPRPGPALLEARAIDDLDLADVVHALAGDGRRQRFVTSVLAELCTDSAVIRYRQDALADLLASRSLRDALAAVLPALATLIQDRGSQVRQQWVVLQIAQRLVELERYVAVALQIRSALEHAGITSAAFRNLRDHILALTSTPEFLSLQKELPNMRATLDQARSITIGINLTQGMQPGSATILSIDPERIEGRSPLLERLFGKGGPKGLSALYEADPSSATNSLYRDLRKLLEEVAGPVQRALRSYLTVNAHGLDDLERELAFLLNGAALVRRLERGGLPVCAPALAPPEERLCRCEDGYNVGLALRLIPARAADEDADPESPAAIVTNPITFDDETARIWILTGPNRGGKTTFTRAVGLLHVLAQAGLYVPARTATLSPVDAIYTHFPTPEGAELNQGKLDEEASRLAHIFERATPHSLILLNEVLAGTSAIEALGLATDAVRGLRLLGCRAIYTTHLHELAARAEEINSSTPGPSRVGSLVAAVEATSEPRHDGVLPPPSPSDAAVDVPTVIGPRHRRTFRILPGPPRGVSYASEIAEQHGIAYGQLVALFQRRGLLDLPVPATPGPPGGASLPTTAAPV